MPWAIAQAQGLSDEEIRDRTAQLRADALAQAVADGLITQEQADWMLERHSAGGAGPQEQDRFGPGRMGGFGPRFALTTP